MLSAEQLQEHIEGCVLNKRESQRILYNSFYGYAMAICDRYTNNQDDAVEILNDGFLKIFKEIYRFKPAYTDTISSFKGWLRKIMIYTAIDHYRKHHNHQNLKDLNETIIEMVGISESALDKISYDEIIKAVQLLSPAYRMVFNLFVIEGYSHEEIAHQVGISVGTSKSNLNKARRNLQKLLFKQSQITLTKNAI